MNVSSETDSSNKLVDYRRLLVAAEQKSQEDFDKTVLTLSGGALAISLTFIKEIIGQQSIESSYLLWFAWTAWTFSTFSVLVSYFLSHLALRRAILQVDNGTIYSQPAGGKFAFYTALLNGIGGVLFLIGILCFIFFAGVNLTTKGVNNDRKETAISPTSTATSSAKFATTYTDKGQATRYGRLYPAATAAATS